METVERETVTSLKGTDMNTIIYKHVNARVFLRPLAAMLIMGMAGAVHAHAQDASEHCMAEKMGGQVLARSEALRQCAAEGFVDAASIGADTAARTSTNDLHPHLSFGSDAGNAAEATGINTVAVGAGAVASGEGSFAFGVNAEASGEGSFAFGVGAKATDSVGGVGQALAIGTGADATAYNTMAIGSYSKVTAQGAIAIGAYAKVYGMDDPYVGGAQDGVAIGNNAWVGPNRGDGFHTDGTAAVAIGNNAHAQGDHAVAIGSGSVAEDNYTLAVGSKSNRRRIVNMDKGIVDSDAAAMGQLRATADALGGGAAFDTSGNFIAPTFEVQGTEHRTVADALGALDDGLKATNGRVDALEAGGGGDGLVGQDDVTGEISVGRSTGGTVVDFAGAAGARVLTGVADGRLGEGSREAVNGGQLAAIRDELSGRVDNLDGRVGQLESGGPGDGGGTPPPGGPGNDAGGRPISNVGDGVADSDAANVGQVNKQVEQALGTARQYTDQRVDALAGALDSFKGEVNERFSRQDQRMNQIGAMSAANAQMAINAAGVAPGKGRVAVGVGMQSNQKAMSVGYAKSINPRVRISVGGSFSGSQNSVGAGMGFDL
jgi:Hep_Hag./YadA-like C-terminal region.